MSGVGEGRSDERVVCDEGAFEQGQHSPVHGVRTGTRARWTHPMNSVSWSATASRSGALDGR